MESEVVHSAPEAGLTPQELSQNEIMDWIRPVQDPELHLSLVDLGLIYKADFEPHSKQVSIEMTLTSPGCPAGDYMIHQLKERLSEHPNVSSSEVKIVWDPKWNPEEMASDECKEALGLW